MYMGSRRGAVSIARQHAGGCRGFLTPETYPQTLWTTLWSVQWRARWRAVSTRVSSCSIRDCRPPSNRPNAPPELARAGDQMTGSVRPEAVIRREDSHPERRRHPKPGGRRAPHTPLSRCRGRVAQVLFASESDSCRKSDLRMRCSSAHPIISQSRC